MLKPNKKVLIALAVAVMMIAASGTARAELLTFSNQAGQNGGLFSIGSTVTIGVVDNAQTSGAPATATGDARISAVAVTPGSAFPVSGTCTTFGCLELVTGTYVGPDLSTLANDYIYLGSGSLIRIIGTADGVTGTLWTGAFDATSNIILQFDDNCGAGPTASATCTGSLVGTLADGSLNATLAAALGILPGTTGGNLTNLFFSYSGTITGTALVSPSGTGIANTNSLQTAVGVIPEPGSMLLLGTGLLGFARAARRRFF